MFNENWLFILNLRILLLSNQIIYEFFGHNLILLIIKII